MRRTLAIAIMIACPILASAGELRVIAKQEKNEPCQAGDTPVWASKYCKSGGTGLAHCDDGKVVIDIDAQPYCRITIYEHSR
ncbi:hypothetical protein [Mesorhizobium sp.]|uniref:hypothetical protein n=1 Tax=Mesorhizobium sp. TaxID=1871066 RepID=UPI000FE7B6A6|nr:hypothetical protein [Mesorhizobium sp.]RWD97791.1 MAG: hypothetical protein EOS40_26805 [Mesorhizobium sp.]